MSRINDRFAGLQAKGQTGFIPYITAGDPSLERTADLVLELERRGADIVELGVPFSDPLADGPVNQAGAQRALAAGTTLAKILDMVESLRARTQIPIVLFTYYNPVHRFGLERLVARAADAGVDGILALDLPPEEAGDYKRLMDAANLDTIFLITPTSTDERIRLITSVTTGFVYYVSRTGVTGEREEMADTISPMLSKIRSHTDQPIAVGFGISTPEQSRDIGAFADAVVVGSAIVRRIGEIGDAPELLGDVGELVGALVRPLKGDANGHR
jgi:tryptophan synthase alpha chain